MNYRLSIIFSFSILASTNVQAAEKVTKPIFSKVTVPTTSNMFQGNHAFADLNADGKMDLLVKGRNLDNGWNPEAFALLNAGQEFTSKLTFDLVKGWHKVITPIDYNNDGYPDVLLSASYGADLYRNEGGKKLVKVDNFSIEDLELDNDDNKETRYAGLVSIADFNADGWQDIVTFDKSGNPVLYLNNKGTGSFMKKDNAGLAQQRNGTLASADFNNDGYIDLAVSGWSDVAGGTYLSVYKNNGDGTFTDIKADTSVGGSIAGTEKGQIMWVDANADGQMDLFITGSASLYSWASKALLYLNNGNGTFTKHTTDFIGVKKSGTAWCDVNGDGTTDILYAGEIQGGKAVTFVALGKKDGSFEVHDNLMSGVRSGAAVSLFDYNANGMPDAVCMGWGDGDKFAIYTGIVLKGLNTRPTAPTGLQMQNEADGVVLSWNAATDKETPVAALRYNVFVKLKNGKTYTLTPANINIGTLLIPDVNNTIATRSYRLKMAASDIDSWGVQTIDQGKSASVFATSQTTGIETIGQDLNTHITLTQNGFEAIVQENAEICIFDMPGSLLERQTVKSGTTYTYNLPKGIYVVRIKTINNSRTFKVMVR